MSLVSGPRASREGRNGIRPSRFRRVPTILSASLGAGHSSSWIPLVGRESAVSIYVVSGIAIGVIVGALIGGVFFGGALSGVGIGIALGSGVTGGLIAFACAQK